MQERNNNSAEFFSKVEMVPGAKKIDPILVADKISRSFGGLTAVDVDHLEIQRGAITALIGPNGAGKTTFFNLLTGYDKPNQGEWSFNGKKLNHVPPYRVARLGMVRTFQLTKALYRLTVIQNMALAAKDQKGESLLRSLFPFTWRKQEEAIRLRSEEILKKMILQPHSLVANENY
jgi:branched-chain amino acid transport system ATP-binding protein